MKHLIEIIYFFLQYLLQRLTTEVTATPFSVKTLSLSEEVCKRGIIPSSVSTDQKSFTCQHCGKKFTSKRKHQRHVLNVHFGYNPVQCPFCNKGHRDNYNLKQHVCPVLNMKYGVYEKKNAAAPGDSDQRIEASGSVLNKSNTALTTLLKLSR